MVATIELGGDTTFLHSTLPHPHRLIIDIKNARQTVGPITKVGEQVVINVGEGGIERVRVGQMGSNVRIVFDTMAAPRYQIEREGTRILIRFGAQPATHSTTSQAPPPQPSAVPAPSLVRASEPNPTQPSPAVPSAKLTEEPKAEVKRVIPRAEGVAPSTNPSPTTQSLEPAKAGLQVKPAAPSSAAPTPSPTTSAKPTGLKAESAKRVDKPQAKEKSAAKSGKKNFKEGMKYEELQQWDLAVQEFTLAAAAEPASTEYRLHLLRAKQNASIMAMKRGDALAEQGDYPGAYTAYHQASSYDPTNELAQTKRERLTAQQKAPPGDSFNYNPRTGNVVPAGHEIKTAPRTRPREVVQAIIYKDTSLRLVIEQIADFLELNVLFDDSFKDDNKFRIKLNNVTMARALDMILLQTKHVFEQIDRRTILIYADNPVNRQRFEQMLVKTFYLGNADLEQARALLQNVTGVQRQVIPVKQLNALVVRDTPRNLRMMQEVLDSIDKNRAEVVIDVDIYEVSRSTSLELGNQLALSSQPITQTVFDKNGQPVTVTMGSSSSLSNLGGVGRASIAAIAGATASPFLGGVGTILGLPPSSLSLLQSKGNSRLLASTQIHALDGEQNQTKVGRSVPVRTGTNYVPGYSALAQTPGTSPAGALPNVLGGSSPGAFDSIQYKDVGLVIDATPQITTEGYVQIKMKLESTSVEPTGTDINLTPSFTQRSLTTIARVQDSKTAVVAGIKQESKGDTRAGVPVLGLIPVLGRFITTPRQTSSLSDIVITVTPHIIRSAGLKLEDHLARFAGSQVGGIIPTIEELIQHAQADDDQERRLIARQMQAQTSAQPSATDQPAQTATPIAGPAPQVETASIPAANSRQRVATLNGLPPSPAATLTTPRPTPPQPARPEAAVAKTSATTPEVQEGSATFAATQQTMATAIDLKLVPITSKQQIGKSVFIAVAVNTQVSMTGAKLSLTYDPALLRLKAVRDSGLLGDRADLTHQEDGGRLQIALQQDQRESSPVTANGQLLLIEFTAVGAGQAVIDFNLGETALVLGSNLNRQIEGQGTAVQISR